MEKQTIGNKININIFLVILMIFGGVILVAGAAFLFFFIIGGAIGGAIAGLLVALGVMLITWQFFHGPCPTSWFLSMTKHYFSTKMQSTLTKSRASEPKVSLL